ncbi:MAG: T9SS type B sorting domain-containing protein [Flavobacteriales bacterium]|nr:MAG: T9SS type B sorting domain-containing protein [Flavobacteriales bacterium]
MKRNPRTPRLFTALLLALGLVVSVHGQLIINQTQPPATLVQNVLMGSGVFASNVTFNGAPGTVVPPTGVGPSEMGRFNGTNTNLGLNSGIFLCTSVANSHLPGPNDQAMVPGGGIGASQGIQTPDVDLSHLTGWPNWQVSGGGNIYNKAVLEFDFVPINDMISVRYVFTSEEYETWACSQYNDVFGFFISGPGIPTNINGPFTNNAMNIALLPNSLTRVSINTVNSGLMNAANANGPDWLSPFQPCFDADPNWQANAPYYRYNGGQFSGWMQTQEPYASDPYYIQHNGLTVVLTATAAVQCGQLYHIKLGVANVGDSHYPSAVYLEQGSFTSTDRFSLEVAPGPNVAYTATDTILTEYDCDSVYLRFHRHGGTYLDEWLRIEANGSATGGVDYMPLLPDSIHFNQLDTMVVVPIAVPVDADGLEDLEIKIITCNGLKVRTYNFPIDQRPPLEVELEDIDLTCPATVTLTPTVSGGGEDPDGYEYLWSTGETTSSISAYVQVTTQFWVRVKDCWSEAETDSAWVTLPPYDPMVLTITPDTAIPCLGEAELQVSATLGSGGYTYAWLLNGAQQGTDSTLLVPAPLAPVYYVAVVTDLCGVEARDSVLVSQASPVPLELTLTPDTAIACLGTADLIASITGGGGEISYTWRHGGAVVGTDSVLNVPAAVHAVYTVEVSDQCGQTVTGEVEVTTGPTPPLLLQAEGDTVLCANMPMVLQVLTVSGGGGAYSYAWSPSGAGGNDGPSLDVSVMDDAYFTVTVTDECGNVADTTLAAVVLDHAPLVITAANDTIVCPGEEVPLWVAAEGGAGNNVIVWPGIGTGDSLTWRAGTTDRLVVVEVTDACGIRVTDTVQVSVYPAQAWIDADELGDSHWRFAAQTRPTTGVSLSWDLGDGTQVADQVVVEHTYADVESHWVYLYVETPDGCTAVDSVQTTPPSATLYFPNAFSPNGDGVNESFGGEGTLLDRYELWVFDRWGRVMFHSTSPAVRWDGTQEGEPVMNGVYQYKYIAKGLKMPLKQGFGHVTLIR